LLVTATAILEDKARLARHRHDRAGDGDGDGDGG
jgi:hypothetical protein